MIHLETLNYHLCLLSNSINHRQSIEDKSISIEDRTYRLGELVLITQKKIISLKSNDYLDDVRSIKQSLTTLKSYFYYIRYFNQDFCSNKKIKLNEDFPSINPVHQLLDLIETTEKVASIYITNVQDYFKTNSRDIFLKCDLARNKALIFLYDNLIYNLNLSKYLNITSIRNQFPQESIIEIEKEILNRLYIHLTEESYQQVSNQFKALGLIFSSLYMDQQKRIEQKMSDYIQLLSTESYTLQDQHHSVVNLLQEIYQFPAHMEKEYSFIEKSEFYKKSKQLYQVWTQEAISFKKDKRKFDEILGEGICAGSVLNCIAKNLRVPQKEILTISIDARSRYFQALHTAHVLSCCIFTSQIHYEYQQQFNLTDQIDEIERELNQLNYLNDQEHFNKIIEKKKILFDLEEQSKISNLKIRKIITKHSQEKLFPISILNKLGLTFKLIDDEFSNQFDLDIDIFFRSFLNKLIETIPEHQRHFILSIGDAVLVEEKASSTSIQTKPQIQTVDQIRANIDKKIGVDAPKEVKLRLEVLEQINQLRLNSSSAGHSVYLSLSKPYQLRDPSFPNFILESENLDTFKLLLLYWMIFYNYRKITQIIQVSLQDKK